jgi:6-phosphogluconolactonase
VIAQTEIGYAEARTQFLAGGVLLTRREFAAGAAVLAAGRATLAAGRPTLAYVGTNTPTDTAGSRANGEGIYLFEIHPVTGALRLRETFRNHLNPSWLSIDASGSHLYSANQLRPGSVSAFALERPSGRLTLLNTQGAQGAGPAHMSIHPSGKYVFVANYGDGSVAVLPIGPGGELGISTDVKPSLGAAGPVHAASGPPGSFAVSGHDRQHAHMIQSDPGGRFVLSTDLGTDQILVWRFDPGAGQLVPNDPPFVKLPEGDGPRHFAFHPNGRWLYSLQEESSTMAVFDYDSANGKLTAKQKVSTLPKGFGGTDFTSEVAVSSDGRFVYAANRLHDSIAWFGVGRDGTLTWLGEAWTRGDYPCHFAIEPGGRFLYSCNQRSDAVTGFSINRKTGALTFTGHYTPVPSPTVIAFL